jgi:hypothetical protein
VSLPLVIVDGANVVGSVPDGWWRDRLGAARRLLASLAAVPSTGLAGLAGPVEVVLVVEGAARPLAAQTPPDGVRIVSAPGSGDDTIVDLVSTALGESEPTEERVTRACLVVTADRALRERVIVLGAEVVGPCSLPYH